MSKEVGGNLLKKSNFEDTSNAVYLNENDVVKLRFQKIQNWQNLSEIWALKYGLQGLAMSNVLTNAFMNSIYRANFLVNSPKYAAAWVSSIVVSAVVPPAITASILHINYYEPLLKISSANPECPICLELRGLTTYLILGSFMPTAIAWMTSFYHANLYYTIRIPNLDSYWQAGKMRKYFKEVRRIFKSTNSNVYGRLMTTFSLQTIFASVVFFFQQKQFFEHIEPLEFTLGEIKRIKN